MSGFVINEGNVSDERLIPVFALHDFFCKNYPEDENFVAINKLDEFPKKFKKSWCWKSMDDIVVKTKKQFHERVIRNHKNWIPFVEEKLEFPACIKNGETASYKVRGALLGRCLYFENVAYLGFNLNINCFLHEIFLIRNSNWIVKADWENGSKTVKVDELFK